MPRSSGFAAAILAGGPQAIRLQKALIARLAGLADRAAVARGIDVFADAFDSDEPAPHGRRAARRNARAGEARRLMPASGGRHCRPRRHGRR